MEQDITQTNDVSTPDLPTEEEALENSKNPERTGKYIETLKEEKKRAEAEAIKYKNVLESLQPEYEAPINQAPKAEQFKNLTQQEVDNQFKSMVDENGFLDGNKLFKTLEDMDKRTRQAEERAKTAEQKAQHAAINQEQIQRSAIMAKVHEKYPTLDPQNVSVFDKDFYEVVKNELIGQMMQGRTDPMEAANKWASKFVSQGEEMAKTKEEQEKDSEKENKKQQINAVRPRSQSAKGYYEKEEDKALTEQIRQGKKGALAEKLRRMGQ